MGSVVRSRFVKQFEAKTKANNLHTKPRPQRQTLCRICGKPTAGKKYCQSCGDFISKKGIGHDKS